MSMNPILEQLNRTQTTVSRNNPIEMLKQFNEFKRNMFFDYNDEALEYIVSKYHVNLNIAKISLYGVSCISVPF